MLRKLFDTIYTYYYCRKCGALIGSTDNGDEGRNQDFICNECK